MVGWSELLLILGVGGEMGSLFILISVLYSVFVILFLFYCEPPWPFLRRAAYQSNKIKYIIK